MSTYNTNSKLVSHQDSEDAGLLLSLFLMVVLPAFLLWHTQNAQKTMPGFQVFEKYKLQIQNEMHSFQLYTITYPNNAGQTDIYECTETSYPSFEKCEEHRFYFSKSLPSFLDGLAKFSKQTNFREKSTILMVKGHASEETDPGKRSRNFSVSYERTLHAMEILRGVLSREPEFGPFFIDGKPVSDLDPLEGDPVGSRRSEVFLLTSNIEIKEYIFRQDRFGSADTGDKPSRSID